MEVEESVTETGSTEETADAVVVASGSLEVVTAAL